MNKAKAYWLAAAAALLAGAAAYGQTPEMQAKFRTALLEQFGADAKAALSEAPIPADIPVAILPIHGDDDAWLAGQMKIALTEAGKNCVEGRGDPMWDVIINELTWEKRKEPYLDAATCEAFGRLQAAKVLVSGTVRLTALGDRSWRGEVELHATELATKRHLWGKLFVYPVRREPAPMPTPVEAASQLNVGVEVESVHGMERVADDVETWLLGRLVDLGYRVETGKGDDLSLSLEVEGNLYDRTGEWETYKGELKAKLESRGAEARLLGKANFPARGKPGIVPNGERNLAYDMEAQLAPWLKRVLDPGALGFVSVRLVFTLANPLETGADFAMMETLRKTIEGMPGVRSVKLAGQDNDAGTVAYRVVYETEGYPGGFLNMLYAAHPELLDQYQNP